MSVYDADTNDYEWDDITPSLQDQIFDELDSQVDFFKEETNDINVPLDLTDSKAAFDVFLDQLLQIPFKNKPAARKKKAPLGEISVNQMTNTKPVDDKVKEKVHDSQEEAIWGDIDTDLLSNMDMIVSNEKKTEPCKGFSTASGKALKPPSKEAMQKAIQSLKEDHELPRIPHEQLPTMKGFQTASGKSLKPVSEESKKKALSIFQELEESTPVQPTGFMTASKKPIKEPSVQSKQNAKKLFEDLQESKGTKRPLDQPLSTDNRYESVLKQFGGFKRGYSEEPIAVSDQAKRRAVGLFEKDSTVPSDDASPKSVSTVPEMPVNVSPKPSPKTPLVKRNKRIPAIQKQNKPFKSPIIRSNIELTKAAVSNNRNTIKARGNSVFDLTVPNNRYTLSSLGLPLQYTKEQLLSKQFPISVIYMTVQSAKKYVFDDDWGPKRAEQDMIQKGCLPHCLSLAWVENHYALIVWKMACLIRSYPDQFEDCWSKQRVLDQLLYRYEREVNMGHRPVLKKILEQDDISAKHMILFISDIIDIKTPVHYNTSSKYLLQLSDGWYQVPACIDIRMEHAITKKKLRIGHKLSICGAQIAGDRAAQSPLTIHNNSTFLSITTNSSLPARWDAKLGYHKRKLMIRSLPTIFEDGGTVTALDIVVCRKFPMLYTENLPNGTTITRTAREEEEMRRMVQYSAGQGEAIDVPNFRAYQRTAMSRNLHETKPLQERRVSSYFKVRVCDTRSSASQPWATLVLSNANELHHMDIIEGNRYRVFFVIPYRPKNKKYPGLDLKTTRSTRWEPVSLGNMKPDGYMPRSITCCQDIRQQNTTSDFDLVIFVLHTGTATVEDLNGRKLWHQTLLVSDQSQHICKINFRLPFNPFPDIKHQVMGLTNVRYTMHDSAFDITCLKATDESEIISKLSSTPDYMQKGMTGLRAWTSSHQDQIESLFDRVRKITE